MWGSDTPLAQKGEVPRFKGTSTKWVCTVCYFTENDVNAQACEVCDSPNYNNNKVNTNLLRFLLIHLIINFDKIFL